ncbi:MAG: IS21 family transposase [Actinobacteria bacterium]|nr:IS21 family transposase [Actinomycetota bacterium]MBO0788306.1 IS21 family transposase [Actinomycetota bacterium]
MLSVDDWAEIRRLHRAEGLPIRAIARVRGVSRNTVRNALQAEGPPRYQRRRAGSIVDAAEPRIRELLAAYPRMPATVIAQRIGWQNSIRVLSGRVAELRPLYLPPDPASRTVYLAGEIAQHDFWFPPIELPVGFGQARTATQLPVLTMITGYARHVDGLLVPSRGAEDLFAGWWRLIERLGAVPRTLVWDGEGAVGKYRRGGSLLTAETHAFRGVLGAKAIICKPGDPEAKGLLERVHGYLETSFLPGRSFTGPADFNTQLHEFFTQANRRWRRAMGCAPIERIAADKQAMLPLPPVAPATGWRASLRLPRDYYVRLDSNDYSVDPAVIGRRVEVVADLERVRAFCDGRVVADHERAWARHQTLTDPAHWAAAQALRRNQLAVARPPAEPEVQIRCLADYDAALGLDGGIG